MLMMGQRTAGRMKQIRMRPSQSKAVMKYTTSEMLPEYGTAVYNAIADLESKITPADENNPSEEE